MRKFLIIGLLSLTQTLAAIPDWSAVRGAVTVQHNKTNGVVTPQYLSQIFSNLYSLYGYADVLELPRGNVQTQFDGKRTVFADLETLLLSFNTNVTRIEVGGVRGGNFYYDSTSTATTNRGTIFKPTGFNGRIIREYTGSLDPKWFGAGLDTNQHHALIQEALDIGDIHFSGNYTNIIGNTITNYSNRKITGDGIALLRRDTNAVNQDVFRFYNNSNVTLMGVKYDMYNPPNYHRVVGFQSGTNDNILIAYNHIFDSINGTNHYTSGFGDRWFVALNFNSGRNIKIIGNSVICGAQITSSIGPVAGLYILNNTGEGSTANAISLFGSVGASSGVVIRDVFIESNNIKNPASIGIGFGPDAGVTVTNLYYENIAIRNNVITGINTNGFGIYGRIGDLGASMISISGNKINGFTQDGSRGIRLENDEGYSQYHKGVMISGNQITNVSVGIEVFYVQQGSIIDNNLSGVNTGVIVGNASDYTTVSGNVFDVNNVGISQSYAGMLYVENNKFLKWGSSASFHSAIAVNPTSVGAGTLTDLFNNNVFTDTTGTMDIGVRILSVPGVTYRTRFHGNYFDSSITTPIDSAVTDQPTSSMDNIGIPNQLSRREATAGAVILVTDDELQLTTSGVVTLPSASVAKAGKRIYFKTAPGVTATLTPHFLQKIDGIAATKTIDPLGGVVLISDGVDDWDVFYGSLGEVATASNLGAGVVGFYAGKTATNFNFNSLAVSGFGSVASNANVITLTFAQSGETNTMANIGAGTQGIYNNKSGVQFQLNSLAAGSGLTLSSNAGVLTYTLSGSGVGEVNTLTSLGAGQSIVSGKVAADLQVYSLSGVNGISIGAPSSSVIPITLTVTNDITIQISDAVNQIVVGNTGQYWRPVRAGTIKGVTCNLGTAGTGNTEFDVHLNGTTIFSTRPRIETTETSTATSAQPGVISSSAFSANSSLTFHYTTVGTGAINGQVTLLVTYP